MYEVGSILENRFGKNEVVVVKVLELLRNNEYRVADTRDCTFNMTTAQLISKDKTWAVPESNLFFHDTDCMVCHKDGLINLAF